MKELSILSNKAILGGCKPENRQKKALPSHILLKWAAKMLSIRVEPRVYLVPVIFWQGRGFLFFEKENKEEENELSRDNFSLK